MYLEKRRKGSDTPLATTSSKKLLFAIQRDIVGITLGYFEFHCLPA